MRSILVSLSLSLLAFAAGCSGSTDAEAPREDVGSTSSAATVTSLTWSTRNIPVCWETGNGPLDPNFAATVQFSVNDTWGRYGGVIFSGWQGCTSGEAGVHVNAGAGREAFIAYGKNLNGVSYGVQMDQAFNLPDNSFCWADTAVMDTCVEAEALRVFGQVLGFTYDGVDAGSVLNPNSFNTALSTGDVVALQEAYGHKKSAAIVGLGGRCLDVLHGNISTGSQLLQMAACDITGNEELWSGVGTGPVKSALGTAYVGTWTTTPGTQMEVYVEPAAQAQPWAMHTLQVVGIGNKCLAAQGGGTSAGTPIVIETCWQGKTEQMFELDAWGRLVATGSGLCVTGASNGPSQLFLDTCSSSTFTFGHDGSIQSTGGECYDVPSSVTTDGTPVGLNACNGGDNQKWHFTGVISYPLFDSCVDILGSQDYVGVPVDIAACSGQPNQTFDVYF
jgi:hypothetical protein